MKRFLSAGEGYAPFPTNINFRMPRYFPTLRASILYTIGLFFMCLQAIQAKEPDPIPIDRAVLVASVILPDEGTPTFTTQTKQIRPLKIGQKLPRDFVLGISFNHVPERITAADLKGRAVILDIWSTSCGSCIAQFPKMDSLQRVYKDHLSIFLLNRMAGTERTADTPDKILAFWASYMESKPDFDLPVVVANPDAVMMFPASALPHYVWIDSNGRIKAFTGSKEVTAANIERLIAGLSLDVKMKER